MKANFLLILTSVLLACASTGAAGKAPSALSEGEVVVFDHTIHDFGTISTKDGPQRCTFTLTNVSSEPIVIFEVVASCGCTDVKWTRNSIAPGEQGTITATYKNEDGAYPFDKMLTAYITAMERPVILRLRGVVKKK